jgi:hypothetical protein
VTIEPLGRRRLNPSRLSPDEFDLLCFFVIGINFPEAVRIADPDGGADAGLKRPDGSFERCWQSKRFTGQVKWPQCKQSLKDAVKNYGMPLYTFCFARDLTFNQEKLFKKHLIGAHQAVTVDYWGWSRIEGLLFTSDQGQRIAREFFGDPDIDTRALMRALRAGGPLETGGDVLDRIAAIASHLADRDPLYQYVHVATEAGGPMPGPTPQTIVAMQVNRPDSRIRIDAVPRNPNAISSLPATTVYLPPDQAEQFARFQRRGGELELRGVRVEWKNMPSAFEDRESGTRAGRSSAGSRRT